MPRKSAFAAVAVVALIATAGCGGNDDDAAPDQEAEGSRCEPVPAWFLGSLEDGQEEGGWTLGESAAVQSSDSFRGPPALAKNAWFVSVDVRPKPGVVTVLMDDETFRTPDRAGPGSSGGVVLFGLDPDPGDTYQRRILAGYGVSKASDGFTESVKCVGKVLP